MGGRLMGNLKERGTPAGRGPRRLGEISGGGDGRGGRGRSRYSGLLGGPQRPPVCVPASLPGRDESKRMDVNVNWKIRAVFLINFLLFFRNYRGQRGTSAAVCSRAEWKGVEY